MKQVFVSLSLAFALALGSGGATSAFAVDDAAKAMETFQAQEKVRVADEAKKKQEEERKTAQAAVTQQQSQDAAKKTNKSGSKAAMVLGVAVLAAGAIMLIIAKNGQPQLEVPAYFTLAGGAAAMMVGGMMGQNGDKAGGNSSNLGSYGPGYNGGSFDTGTGNSLPGGFKATGSSLTSGAGGGATGNELTSSGAQFDLNSEDLRTGKLGEVLDKFEAQTGIGRDDLLKGLNSGNSMADMLEGKAGLTKAELAAGMSGAKGSGANGGFSSEDLEKLASESGLADLYKEAQGESDYSGGGRAIASLGGSGASTAGTFDFGKLGGAEGPGAGASKDFGKDLLSDDVKKEMARQGRTELSVFELVTNRYRKITPMLFGQDMGFGTVDATPKQEPDMVLN